MSAMREMAINYIQSMPEERLGNAVDYLKLLSENDEGNPKKPSDGMSDEELLAMMDEMFSEVKIDTRGFVFNREEANER